jgi:hypothetical protein
MPHVVVRPRALADLGEIWAFIAEDSVRKADKFAAIIDDHFRALARRPAWDEADRTWHLSFAVSQSANMSSSTCHCPKGSRSSAFYTARATSNQSCKRMSDDAIFFAVHHLAAGRHDS